MNVKSIFKTLIVIVCCVLIGALAINVLLPNVATALVDATEQQIANATGMSFDFNGNATAGDATTGNQDFSTTTNQVKDTDGAEGIDGKDTVKGVAP